MTIPGRTLPLERIAIELPQSEDYERMADLARQLGYACTRGDVQSRIREMVDSKQYAIYVARLSNGLVAGWIGGYVFRSVETEATAEVSGLVVDESIRSRGIGKALLEAIEGWARNTGCGSVEVRSNIVRKSAHRFISRMGTKCSKHRKRFTNPSSTETPRALPAVPSMPFNRRVEMLLRQTLDSACKRVVE